jgi:hypothetical protein
LVRPAQPSKALFSANARSRHRSWPGRAHGDSVKADDRIEAESLDVTGYQPRWGEHVSLRPVMLHLIHEYARHNGHADFLREGIDGTVGA